MLINDELALSNFSNIFSQAMGWLENYLKTIYNAKIIFNGGDNILAQVSNEIPLHLLQELQRNFADIAQSTISIGVGFSAREAFFALQLAKASGKKCIKNFEEFRNG